MKSISESLSEAIDAMGGDLESYLAEAEGKEFEKEFEKSTKPTMMQQLKAEFVGPSKPKKAKAKRPKMNPIKDSADKKKAVGSVKPRLFLAFKNFKKAHGMIMW